MKQFLAIQTLILAVFVLLGNGIRSIGTMSLAVSQSEFASFLDISVEKTDILVEVLLGGAVILMVAGALTPRRTKVPWHAGFTIAVAAASMVSTVFLWWRVRDDGPISAVANAMVGAIPISSSVCATSRISAARRRPCSATRLMR